jgi:UDP-glucose 4-epimerase
MGFEKVICTGGSGHLGRVFVDMMRSHCSITVADIARPAADVAFTEVSILDYEGLKRAFSGHDAVVHLAAISNPRIATAEKTFNVNTQGTWAVLQAAEDAGVKRVVVASSDATSGLLYNPPDLMPQYLPLDEKHPLRPRDAYSLSKVVTETICQSYVTRGKLEVIAIRPTHIIFPEEYGALRAKGLDERNYHLWTYVSPQDVSQAFRLALEAKDIRFDTFLITAADGLNERPTLEMVKARYGTLPAIRNRDYFANRPQASIVDISHAREILGYQPTSNWRDMVAKNPS